MDQSESGRQLDDVVPNQRLGEFVVLLMSQQIRFLVAVRHRSGFVADEGVHVPGLINGEVFVQQRFRSWMVAAGESQSTTILTLTNFLHSTYIRTPASYHQKLLS